MGKTLLNIQVLYDKMGRAEKKIADFLLKNPNEILPLYIGELAKKCGCGEATITRFARRIGYSSFQQMKIALAQDKNMPRVNDNINSYDSAYTIYTKVCNDIYASLEKTRANLNKAKLHEFCEKLLTLKRIYIFGLGNSASIAMDAAHKLSRLGFEATACNDNHMQAIIASHVNEDCLIWGISHSGNSKDIVQAMKIAKENRAITACLTDSNKSPIYKVSDYVLTTISDEINYRILGLNSRIAQLAIIDTIYSYLVCNMKNSKEITHKTEIALLDKKF